MCRNDASSFCINKAPTFPSQGFVMSKRICIFRHWNLTIWQSYIIVLTIPTKSFFSRKERYFLSKWMKLLHKTSVTLMKKNKENSQLKCISLKLRVLIYIEGVFELLTHPLSLYIRSLRIENYIRKYDFLFANFMTIPANIHWVTSIIFKLNPEVF